MLLILLLGHILLVLWKCPILCQIIVSLPEVLIFSFYSNKKASELHWDLQISHRKAVVSRTISFQGFVHFNHSNLDADDRLLERIRKHSKILRWRHCFMGIQTQKDPAFAIGFTCHAISRHFNALKIYRKKEIGFLTICTGETLSIVYLRLNICSSCKVGKCFFISLLQVIIIVFVTAVQRELNNGVSPDMLLPRRLGRIFPMQRVRCVFCEPRAGYLLWSLGPSRNQRWEQYRPLLMPLSRTLCEIQPQYEQRCEKNTLQQVYSQTHIVKLFERVLKL